MSSSARRSSIAKRRIAGLVGVAFAVASLAACAGLPTSDKATVEGKASGQSNSNGSVGIGMTSQEPKKNWHPDDMVRGFLEALSGDDKDPTYKTAKLYLGSEGKTAWDAEEATKSTLVLSGLNIQITSMKEPTGDDPGTATVTVTGNPVAQIDSHGFSMPPVSRDQSTSTLTLTRKASDQAWQIQTLPTYRLIDVNDIRRAIPTPLAVYIPLANEGSSHYHVDQVWLTQSNVLDIYTSLVDAVLYGPNRSIGWRVIQGTGAQRTPTLPVTLDATGSVATVHLSKAPTSGVLVSALGYALYRTLAAVPSTTQYTYAQKITQLKLFYPGGPTAGETFPTLGVPDDSPAAIPPPQPVYFVTNNKVYRFADPGDATNSAPLGNNPVAGWLGTTTNAIGQIAVKHAAPDHGVGETIAAYVEPGEGVANAGKVVVADSSSVEPTVWYTSTAHAVTSLAWDPADGSLWVVDAGRLYHVTRNALTKEPAKPVEDDPAGSGDPSSEAPYTNVQAIRFSPDGQQAVLVTLPAEKGKPDAGQNSAWLALVDRTEQSGGAPAAQPAITTQFQLQPEAVLPRFVNVDDVGWAGNRTVVLLAKDLQSAESKIYAVYADGSQDNDLAGVRDETGQLGASQLAVIGSDTGKVKKYTFTASPGTTAQPAQIYRQVQPPPTLADNGTLPTIATVVFGG